MHANVCELHSKGGEASDESLSLLTKTTNMTTMMNTIVGA
jgi:ribosome maturation protein Sdo1